jgi:hypothetical protein
MPGCCTISWLVITLLHVTPPRGRGRRHRLVNIRGAQIELEREEEWPPISLVPPCIFNRENVENDIVDHSTFRLRWSLSVDLTP